ncbi:MAG: type II toxin-antitoxin system RelB/DinJ family antitoxin [Methanomassiliicoccaceae archaeon]|jgi:addiction module RelB/DinJ family antitoxin|nr:type II toxin-antitoxin system RelB/DinJ family antitoxin [Methanomassiliicoccaceae archaeon]
MAKDTSISIRMDSELKELAEHVIEHFGLNMTVVVNMLFRQIVRDQAIPLSLSLSTPSTSDDPALAKADRAAGHRGRSLDDVIAEMERIVAEADAKRGKNDRR